MRIPLMNTTIRDFWIGILFCLFFFFLFAPDFHHEEIEHNFFDTFGAILVAICSIGRFYTNFYFKEDSFNNKGPYSVVRHPRCLLAFIGIIGIAMVSSRINLMLFMPLMAGFIFLYLINRQENQLILLYGDNYRNYQQNVPRLIPNFKLYKFGKPIKLSASRWFMIGLDFSFWIGIAVCIEYLEKYGL